MGLLVVTLTISLLATACIVDSSIEDQLSRGTAFDIIKRTVTTDEDSDELNLRCSAEKVTEIIAELSVDCQNYLFEEEGSYEFDEESTVMCKSCGSTLFSLLQCIDTDPIELELFNILCADNGNGDTCYSILSGEGVEEADVVEECRDLTCSDECLSIIKESFSNFGCCLYSLVAANTSATMARDIWSVCGLDVPSLCVPAFDENEMPSELETTDGTTVGTTGSSDPEGTTLPSNDGASSSTSDSTESPSVVASDGVSGGQRGTAPGMAEMSFTLGAILFLASVINYLSIK